MTAPKQYPEIDAYLAAQPADKREPLEKIRETMRKALPDADEAISYQMPSFKLYGMIAWYAPSKNHYAIYMPPKYLVQFKEQLAQYSQTKSAIHFDYNKPVPEALITSMVQAAARENLLNKAVKDAAKNTKKAKK